MSGFIYLWYDRKHRRFYIGSHWGTENDGYVCSSAWMRRSYKRRPLDFKRRILSRVEDSRKELLEKELEWLSLIKDHELGKRYYNLRRRAYNVWSDEEIRKKAARKSSETQKGRTFTPEHRAKLAAAKRGKPGNRRGKKMTEEMKKALSNKMKQEPCRIAGWNKGKPSWNKGKQLSPSHKENLKKTFTPERRAQISNAVKKHWANKTD